MRKMNLLKLSIFVLLAVTLGYSQASRTWVSGVGDDANPCSRTAPCKTFAGAISKTAPGGEIDALDPGGFGALTITKAITIDGGGGQVASVLVAGTNGIVVAAGASDVVIIRNLRINGIAGSGNGGINGIRWLSGKALHVQSCYIFGFNNSGIDIAKSDGGEAFISNTSIVNTGNGGTGSGINSSNSVNVVKVTINNSEANQNHHGMFAGDFTNMSINNSQASGNVGGGFVAAANAGTNDMQLANSTASNNDTGIFAGSGAVVSTVRITGVSLFNNASGGMLESTNGTIRSFGNNYNTGTGSPNGAPLPLQ